MSEENTESVETAESTDEVVAPQLGVADLKLMANVLEVVSNRGAIKASEMSAVGGLYNNLMTFLIANGAVELPAQEEATENEGDTDAPEGDDA